MGIPTQQAKAGQSFQNIAFNDAFIGLTSAVSGPLKCCEACGISHKRATLQWVRLTALVRHFHFHLVKNKCQNRFQDPEQKLSPMYFLTSQNLAVPHGNKQRIEYMAYTHH